MGFTPTILEGIILLGTSVISGLVGFGVQIFLPDDIRSKIIYRMKSWRKSRNNNTVTNTLTAKYTLEDSIPLAEASKQLRSNLSSIVDEESRIKDKGSNEPGDRHYIELQTSKTDLTLNARINAPAGGTAPGGYGHEKVAERVAKSITVTSEIRTEYEDLRWALELGAQYFDDFDDATELNLEKSSTYNVTCELNSPTVIEDFLAKLSADSVKAENDSIEVKFEENRVTVRNLAIGDRPDVFDKLQDLIIYYG